jgi:cytochrome o ubiquinol oxidase operon protein cyoD
MKLMPKPEVSRGSAQSYTIGFILSIAFTLLAYFLVVDHSLSTTALAVAIVILAIAQMFIQLIFFLHLGQGSDSRWNMIILAFAGIVILIVVVGSVWIMSNLNRNMGAPSDVNQSIIQAEGIPK